MKDSKQGFWQKAAEFAAGKGFYMILFLCAAAIGVSGYLLFFTEPENTTDTPLQMNDLDLPGSQKETTPQTTPEQETPVENHVTVEMPPKQQETKKETKAAEQPKTVSAPATVPAAKKVVAETFIAPCKGEIQRPYSGVELVQDPTMGDWRVHIGADYACDEGEKIMAIGDGTVKEIFYDELAGYCMTIDHGNSVTSTLRGLMKNATVKKGDTVKMGQVVAGAGNTMICESKQPCHIHLEVTKNGKTIDPQELIGK